jgi:hypothetical protein
VILDLKLDREDPQRPEIALPDFGLPQEVVRLMKRLDELVTTTIDRLEVHAGVPRRVSLVTDAPRTLLGRQY